MLLFNLLFQFIIATAPAFSSTQSSLPTFPATKCGPILSSQAATPAATSEVKKSFVEVLSKTLNLAGVDETVQAKIFAAANDLDIREADIEAEEIKIRAKFYGESFFSSRKGRFVLRWPSAQKISSANETVLINKIAEIVGTLLFKPITSIGAYRQTQSKFISDHLEAITYKLFLQYYAVPKTESELLPDKSGLSRILGIVLRKLLPFQKSEVRAAQIDQKTFALFDLGGPAAVFGYLHNFFAPPLALNYWMTHAQNGGVALALTFALYMSPTVVETWQLMKQEGSVTIGAADHLIAKGILDQLEKSDVQMIEEIKARSNDAQEAKILSQFLSRYQNEIQTSK